MCYSYERSDPMKYYISDLHLFHANSIAFDERPFASLEEMHDTILNNWNTRVTNGDIVYILGDISFRGKNEDLIAFVSRLKGRKVLVKGNHDDVSDYRYQQLFTEICDYKEIVDTANRENYWLVLSHYPIFSWRNMSRGQILLYGHTHNSQEDIYFQKCLSEMEKNGCRHVNGKKLRAINVGCMKPYMDYSPRPLEELLQAAGAVTNTED